MEYKFNIEITYVTPSEESSAAVTDIASEARDFAKNIEESFLISADGDRVIVSVDPPIEKPDPAVIYDSND